MWVSFAKDFLKGLYLLYHRINGMTYHIFLKAVLPEVFNNILVGIRNIKCDICIIISISHLIFYRFDEVDQRFCHHVLPIYQVSVFFSWGHEGAPKYSDEGISFQDFQPLLQVLVKHFVSPKEDGSHLLDSARSVSILIVHN
ncbi:hypothetical protein TNCT_666611 [Trichonephila clavata]|uniref:Uncharacterized protein n=1 Tax=Trichonephila clavata TaxID=2740835 RepID=A0A8X6L1X8_TRICU|nr:hypothetical protein TNCT_666611 [Trichonephila clavata]